MNLLEVTLTNNPITRKQAYRPMLINRCPRLSVADGQVRCAGAPSYNDGTPHLHLPACVPRGGGRGREGLPPLLPERQVWLPPFNKDETPYLHLPACVPGR